jgi:hypothetical protein
VARGRCDNGPELTANALRDWCRFSGTGSAYIEPGSPWQNPYVESFGSRVRDELLAVELFSCLAEAQVMVADWRDDYNEHRPHSSLGMTAPAAFARDWRRTNPPDDQCARGISLRSPSGLTPRDTGGNPQHYPATQTRPPTLTPGGPMNGVPPTALRRLPDLSLAVRVAGWGRRWVRGSWCRAR